MFVWVTVHTDVDAEYINVFSSEAAAERHKAETASRLWAEFINSPPPDNTEYNFFDGPRRYGRGDEYDQYFTIEKHEVED